MKRRVLLGTMGAAAVLPAVAHAQQSTLPRAGFLASASPGPGLPIEAFLHGLAEAGFTDGQNVAIDYRFAKGDYDQLPTLAADLVKRQPRVLVAAALPAALAVKAATTTIPIVFFSGGDPVQQGLVASLGRPGGNLTGACVFINDLGPKRLELLHQLMPTSTTFGYLANPSNPNVQLQLEEMQKAAQASGLTVIALRAATAEAIEPAFAALVDQHGGGLIVGADPFFGTQQQQILALSTRHAIPSIATNRAFAEAGGIMAYGNRLEDAYQQVGHYTGQVLKGTKPADLPVVRATKFELIVNLKGARALGLTIPPALLARADEVIE